LTAVTSAASLSGCSSDLSCAETATCPPSAVDDAAPDVGRDTSNDATDASSTDRAASADGQGRDARIEGSAGDAGPETRNDGANPADSRVSDGAAIDSTGIAPDSGANSDAARIGDASTDRPDSDELDAGSPTIDVAADLDAALDTVPDVEPPRDAASETGDACALNACGGCGPLGATPGAACGQCGTYVCAADKLSVACEDPGYLRYKSVSVGGYRTCGLTTTGGVRCWGARASGIEDGDPFPPSQDFLTGVASISTGWWYSCAIMNSGALRCWGNNISGQLGDGTTDHRWTAPTMDILAETLGVATADAHTCALSLAGGVKCWGDNFYNQLGDGTTVERHRPPTTETIVGVQAIAAHQFYSCTVTAAGGVRCWGTFSGEYGNGSIASPPTSDLFSGASAVSTGLEHACALMTNGDIRCWGKNTAGQLGDGTTTPHPGPPTTAVLGNAQAVVAGRRHTCALTSTGAVRCWGGNYDGQLGDGTTNNRTDAQTAPEVLNGVSMIASGGADHTCALLTTGRIRCWGNNSYWQLGAGKIVTQTRPIDVQDVCP
jgi:alpha-tubulin suppressor-like RCC1 family protein